MSKKLGYQAAKTNKTDKGSFGNRGQKPGKPGPVKQEKLVNIHADKVMEKALAQMRKHLKRNSTLSYYDNVKPEMSK